MGGKKNKMAEEVTDEEIKQLEEELKKLEGKDSGYGSPSAQVKESLFKFFDKILTIKDTTRIGNLTTPELGMCRLSVRGNKSIAIYAESEGLDKVRDYFNNQASIITESSMARKGFWSQLFVTQIKKEQKVKESTPEKKKWFGKKEEGAGE